MAKEDPSVAALPHTDPIGKYVEELLQRERTLRDLLKPTDALKRLEQNLPMSQLMASMKNGARLVGNSNNWAGVLPTHPPTSPLLEFEVRAKRCADLKHEEDHALRVRIANLMESIAATLAETRTTQEGTPPGGDPKTPRSPSAPRTPKPSRNQGQRDPVFEGIKLLSRDAGQIRSTRAYARELGVSHTTLGRNPLWKNAIALASQSGSGGAERIPRGAKDPNGVVEAYVQEVCENCRQEPISKTVRRGSYTFRVCEACADEDLR